MQTATETEASVPWPPDPGVLLLLQHSSDIILVFDEQARCLWCNEAAEAHWHPVAPTGETGEALFRSVTGQQELPFSELMQTPLMLGEHRTRLMRTSCGGFLIQSASEPRKPAEREERLRPTGEAGHALVYDWNLQTNEVVRSEGLATILGYNPHEVPGDSDWWFSRVHPDDVARVLQEYRGILHTEARQCAAEYRVRHANGHWVTVHDQALIIRDSIGATVRIVGMRADIRGRRDAEEQLRASEERYRFLTEAMPQLVWTGEVDGSISYINHQFANYTGLTLPEARTGEWLKLVHSDDLPELRKRVQTSIATGVPFDAEFRLLRVSDRMYRWHLARARIFELPGGVQRWFGTAVDIHDLRCAEEDLRRSEQWQNIAVEAGNVGLWDWDIPSDRVEWSDRVYALHGLAPGTFEGTSGAFAALVHPDDVRHVTDSLSAALGGVRRYKVEFRTTTRDSGELRWLSTEGQVIFDALHRPVRMLGAVADVTERKRHEQALQFANEELKRVNSDLEQFAYAAAHDLQEPLRMITLYTQLLKRRFGDKLDEAGQHHVEQAFRGAERMRRLVEDLLAYTRANYDASSDSSELVDLRQLVEELCAGLGPMLAEAAATVQADPSLPSLRANRSRLIQLLQNLIVNAVKYRRADVPPVIMVRCFQSASERVVEVADNGIGIAPEYHEKIFGVFRRLHGQEIEGTGIGLALCRRIVERCGGQLWVESAGEGDGSRFRFTLPLAFRSTNKEIARI